jgi:hypothetical protein
MSYLFRIYGSGTHRILVKTSTIVEISTFTFIGDTKRQEHLDKETRVVMGILFFLFLVSK